MPLDKVLSASIANAAVNASAISNTANLVIGALNTGNTVVTGNLTSNTLTLTLAGSQNNYPVNVVLSGNGPFQRVFNSYNANLVANDSIIAVYGKYPNNYNAGYIGYNHQGDSSTNNFVGIGMWNQDYVVSVTAKQSVGINTHLPTPHNGNGLVVAGANTGEQRAIIELWEKSGASGKAVFQQVAGATFIGNLNKGSGNGSLILLSNGTGSNATETMTLYANSDVLIGDPTYIRTGTSAPNNRRLRFDGSYDGSSTTDPTGLPCNKIVLHDSGGGWMGGFGISDGTVNMFSGGNTVFYRSTNSTSVGTKSMVLTNNGHVIKPYQPAFVSNISGNIEPTTDTKLPYDTLTANNGAHFSTSTNTFTAPVAGFYSFNWRAWFKQGITGTVFLYLKVNGSIYTESRFNTPTVNGDYDTLSMSWIVKLAASDSVYLSGYSPTGGLHTSNSIRYSEFSGYYLG